MVRKRKWAVHKPTSTVNRGLHYIFNTHLVPRTAQVFANRILFNEDGSYAGFDPEEFTSRSGGKCEAVKHIKQKWALGSIVMVGDGATDAEARQPGGADVFIGYGGVVFRQAVAERADWYLTDIRAITQALAG